MCGKLETVWMAYLDGKASEQERTLVEAHLGECPACARRKQEFVAVAQILGEWPAPEPSPWFDARLRRRIIEDAGHTSWFPHLSELFPPVPVSVGALIVLACLLIFSGGQSNVTPPPTQAIASNPRMEEVLRAADEVQLLNEFDLLSELRSEGTRPEERH